MTERNHDGVCICIDHDQLVCSNDIQQCVDNSFVYGSVVLRPKRSSCSPSAIFELKSRRKWCPKIGAMPLSGKDSLNFLFMGGSTALIAHGALARTAEGPDSYMRLHPFLMGLAFSLMISLGFWMCPCLKALAA